MKNWFREQIRKFKEGKKEEEDSKEILKERIKDLQKAVKDSRESLIETQEKAKRIESDLKFKEMEKKLREDRERYKQDYEEREKEKERKEDEKILSVYLTKYLDNYKIINNRFSIDNNYDKINSHPNSLIFQIIQMIKIGKKGIDYVTVYNDNLVRLKIKSTGEIKYSINNHDFSSKEIIGIKFLKKFISDIEKEIEDIPSIHNSKVYVIGKEVGSSSYSYVLAKNENACRNIVNKDTFRIKEIPFSQIDESAYIKSIKTNLIYSD